MDPLYEQGLRDEVIYLHSLWRQGPPRHHHHLNPYSYPQTTDAPLRVLRPSHPIQFKKNKHKTILNNRNPSRPPIDPGPEWPVPKSPENVPLTSSGWPSLNLPPPTKLPSPGDLARFAASKLQQRTMKAARDFFSAGNADDDDDDEEEEDNSEDEEGDDLMEDVERKEYNFFHNIFMEESDLRDYYKSKCKGGEFFCLVCGGSATKGKGGTKKFKNCLALIQHSLSITKTKKKRAHRAYAEVICEVIDWDINQLSSYSSIIALSGDSEIQTLQAVATDSNSESLQNGAVLPVSNVTGLLEVTNNAEGSHVNNPTENAVSSTGGDASKQEATAVNALCGQISSNMVLETM